MKHILRKVLFVLNLIIAISLLASYVSAFVSPAKIWILAFFGLIYPFLLILNILFLLFWLFFKKYHFLLSFVCILVGLPFLRRVIQIDFPFKDKYYYQQKYQPGNKTFKLLTFNVRLFNLYKWENKPDAKADIYDFIDRENPDIVCFQEFYTRDSSSFSEVRVRRMMQKFPHVHIYYSLNKKSKSHFGLATFSTYPIVGQGEIKFPNTFNLCIYTDLRIGHDTVRVYNNHLQSIKFLKEDYGLIDTFKLEYDERQMKGLKRMVYRVGDAFKMRSKQVEAVSAHIKTCKHPVIVCGDFNDSPVSYTYQTMRMEFKDAFIESGNGIGITYRGKFPSYRIDYILYDPLLKSYDYQTPKLELSDHYPLVCRFVLP